MAEFWQGAIIFATLFVMMIGLIFTVLPPIPGTLVIWAAAIFYGLVMGWENLGWWIFGILTFLMIVGLVVDVVAGHFGAKLGGASCLAIFIGAVLGLILGIVASLIGTPILGCFAGLVGMVLGVLWIEWKRKGDWDRALRATKGYVAGTAAGVMARFTSGILMLAIFLVKIYGLV
ncbi:MAG: DUF456 domain-containing protein [Anaerolineae bacterium]|nr:DUF456 domain-containing protein [Anaerolineae bacterium]